LVSIITVLIPTSFYKNLFTGNVLIDSLLGDFIGSVMLGNPITAYVLGSEFLSNGISLVAVTAFMVAWVTVGLVQLPAESALLGRRFAIVRNVSAFLFALIVAAATVGVLAVI